MDSFKDDPNRSFLNLNDFLQQNELLVDEYHKHFEITEAFAKKIKLFIRRGVATGAIVEAPHDRWNMQSQLDYWATSLRRSDYDINSTLEKFDTSKVPQLDDLDCPYPGLAGFQETDGRIFFGRTKFVKESIKKFNQHNLIAIIGPSGSGKSSLMQAGIIPKLKLSQETENMHFFDILVPGSHPLNNLAMLLTQADQSDGKNVDTSIITSQLLDDTSFLTEYISKHFKKICDIFHRSI